MKIVINSCYGGFSLSDKATEMYLALKGKKYYKYPNKWDIMGSQFLFCPKEEYERLESEYKQKYGDWKKFNELNLYFCNREIPRNDPDLIEVVEKLGKEANGQFANLKIVNIPDDVKWEVCEYDGNETVEEVHRIWS